uniref:Uncharacterized protein n=1 Tax=Daphnia magna TaxID=35525 RepID=A0A0P6J2W0_9CRUS
MVDDVLVYSFTLLFVVYHSTELNRTIFGWVFFVMKFLGKEKSFRFDVRPVRLTTYTTTGSHQPHAEASTFNWLSLCKND